MPEVFVNWARMRLVILILFLVVGQVVSAIGQAIIGTDFHYDYDPDAEIGMQIRPVRKGNTVLLLCRLYSNRKDVSVSDYTVTWEQRSSVNVRTGPPIESPVTELSSGQSFRLFQLEAPTNPKAWYATARVVSQTNRGEHLFYVPVEPNWPSVFHLEDASGSPVMEDFIQTKTRYVLKGLKEGKKTFGFLYKRSFSPAPPPFVSKTKEEQFLKADSTFIVEGDSFSPASEGLYLFQQDTASAEGLSVWAGEKPFPRYNRISALTGPLIYITTPEENQALSAVGQDKQKFDKIVLGITDDKERAKSFMRTYYQRVERVNRLFTGYKEGWKTDMGMVYLIFGPPSEVSRTTANEIWFYKDTRMKFIFYRTGSIFDPAGYFLQHSETYTQGWFSTVDLWRKGRF